jgi:hypothetical protein
LLKPSVLHFDVTVYSSHFEMADLDKVADSEDPRLAMLREIVKSFMLRRTKAALVHSKALVLPPLSEVTM